MAKITITDEEFKKLSKDLQGEYAKDGEEYKLKLEDADGEDLGNLRGAKDHEKKRRQDAEKKLKEKEKAFEELETKYEELETSGTGSIKDKEALEKSWKGKLEKTEGKLKEALGKRDAQIRRLMIDEKAAEIAARISTSPKAMKRILQDRLTIEEDGDEYVVRILDADGKPSALSVLELEKEIASDKEYSGIIKGSQASGGGAEKGGQGGGGAFNIADFRNQDGTTNWSKVAEANKADPTVLTKVKEANANPATAAVGAPPAQT